MQVVRRHPIDPSIMAVNRAYWNTPGVKGTVWERYMLVAVQWPTSREPPAPSNDGGYFPGGSGGGRRARRILQVDRGGGGEPDQHDDGDLSAGPAVELHGLPPGCLQRPRRRFRRHPRRSSVVSEKYGARRRRHRLAHRCFREAPPVGRRLPALSFGGMLLLDERAPILWFVSRRRSKAQSS